MAHLRTLRERLQDLEDRRPAAWNEVGARARPHLHGILRYPAMMVPRMQGDIIDAIRSVGWAGGIADPFVGSGTVMTEALLRNLPFAGIDINPLAILVCEAKAAIDAGVDLDGAASATLRACRLDDGDRIDVDFPGLSKWFDQAAAERLSRIRRAIVDVPDGAARKVLWTVFAETIRVSSRSRTSTYKLHVRPPHDQVDPDRIPAIFEANLVRTLERVAEYRGAMPARSTGAPAIHLRCGDARVTPLGPCDGRGQMIVSSPPYGDNQTTVAYGQYSYLALRWILPEDALDGDGSSLVANAAALDTASLGGSMRGAADKATRLAAVSPSLDLAMQAAAADGNDSDLRKVTTFVADLRETFDHLRATSAGAAFWVLTTGNRTAHGMRVPLDQICRDILHGLGGKSIHDIKRRLPNKRMPTHNDRGSLINAETTLVFEFA